MSLDEAKLAVRKEIFRSTPTMNPSAQFPLKEITTPEVWTRLHAQIFKITDGAREDEDYLVYRKQIYGLGGGFGGYGIMSMCVADLNGDGRPALLFSYSWGSGIHRSLIGLWSGGPLWIDAQPALRNYDLLLEKVDDTRVRIAYGTFNPAKGRIDRQGEFGTLHFAESGQNSRLDIFLSQQLPQAVADSVWYQPQRSQE